MKHQMKNSVTIQIHVSMSLKYKVAKISFDDQYNQYTYAQT